MSTALVRSPQALAPLVEEQVSLGYEAGYKFYVAAGHLLLEARETIKSDAKWGQYVKARGISPRQSQEWMRSAEGEKRGLGHKTVRGSRTDPRTSRVTHCISPLTCPIHRRSGGNIKKVCRKLWTPGSGNCPGNGTPMPGVRALCS